MPHIGYYVPSEIIRKLFEEYKASLEEDVQVLDLEDFDDMLADILQHEAHSTAEVEK